MITIEQRISDFKSELINQTTEYVLRKNIIFGNCYHLESKLYYELKQEIANKFELHPSCILMVGSGKLGFSLSEKNILDNQKKVIGKKDRYRSFSDNSDLDIAIVSPSLFDRYWVSVFEHMKSKPWYCGKEFKDYLFEGWIRPDKLPPSTHSFNIKKEWFEYFENLSCTGKYGSYGITAGLYKDWSFLETYQLKSISQCKSLLVEDI